MRGRIFGTLALLGALLSSFSMAGCSAEDAAGDEPESKDDDFIGRGILGPEPSGRPTAHPILLVSGFATSPTLNNFRGVPEAFRADGHRVFIANLPPYDSAAVRGAALAREIERVLRESGASKVNLLAHSMGGLDARVAIHDHELGDRVATLTTISSPHRGSKLGDLGESLFRNGNHDALNAFAAYIGARFSDVASDSHLYDAFVSLSTASEGKFNADHPDDPRVFYQSWAGVAGVAGAFNPADDGACENRRFGGKRVSGIIHAFMLPMAAVSGVVPQDGMVTVDSAKHGEFRGCLPGDHLDEVGDALAIGAHPITRFDRVRFYRNLAFELASRGY